MKYLRFLLIPVFVVGLFSCSEDDLNTAPERTISDVQLASNPASFQAVVDGTYAAMRTFQIGDRGGHIDYGHKAIQLATDFMSHDVTMSFLHWYGFFYSYDGRVQANSRSRMVWNTYYKFVAEANSIISSVDQSNLDDNGRAVLGQAYTARGFCMFYLARMFAHTYLGHEGEPCIPLVDGANFEGKPRATVAEVYDQIVNDLTNAVDLLAGYARPNKQAIDQSVALGHLAAVHLEMGNWSEAASAAAQARANYTLMSGTDWLESGFRDISNPEWMWGADIDNESSTVFASFFSHMDNTSGGYAGALGVYKLIDADLYSQISDTDMRKQAFVDPVNGNPDFPVLPAYANTKFRDNTFFEADYVYMRAAEMYLIEAEALARMGDANAAQVLFDLVSTRDPGYSLSSATGDDLVEEVYLHRRIELWGEGTAWFDLKRLKKPLVRDYEGSNHAAFGLFNEEAEGNSFRFQIPEDEINANDAISASDQNPL